MIKRWKKLHGQNSSTQALHGQDSSTSDPEARPLVQKKNQCMGGLYYFMWLRRIKAYIVGW